MTSPLDDPKLLLSDDDSQGWYKLIIPNISDIFGAIWNNPAPGAQTELMPFIYCKFDSEQVAFDIELSQPLYALDKVCLVQVDRAPKSNSKIIPVTIIGLGAISAEQEGRCFLPTVVVSCIIPVRPSHELVDSLKKATTESLLVTPTIQEASSIINLPEKENI